LHKTDINDFSWQLSFYHKVESLIKVFISWFSPHQLFLQILKAIATGDLNNQIKESITAVREAPLYSFQKKGSIAVAGRDTK
jgi:hypothetical protein